MKNVIVTDSGVGGIAILKQLRKFLPHTDFVYFADNKNFPYGDKTESQLCRIAVDNTRKLQENYDFEVMVVACNTMTARAIDALRAAFPSVSFVGTEPSLKQALTYTAGNVLLLCTQSAALSARLKKRFDYPNIIWQPMPLLAEMVEHGASKSEMRSYIESIAANVSDFDCVVLGCTHYCIVRDLIESVFVGKKVFDGNLGVATYVKNLLAKADKRNSGNINPVTNIVLSAPDANSYAKYVDLIMSNSGK